ncbi:MAG: hypothetical protein MUF34_29750 [Polyangiaceae bacterium]|nr:hypothetical protein [Polyangiaceae bacterium]
MQDLLAAPRFGNDRERDPIGAGLPNGGHALVGRDHEPGHRRLRRGGMPQQLEAVHFGHGVVDERDVETLRAQQRQRFGPRAGEVHRKVFAENATECIEVLDLVVDHQHGGQGFDGHDGKSPE